MHVSYVILGISIFLTKLKFPKKITKICTILLLIFFIFLTGESPSVKRACIMSIMSITSTLIYRKSDIITNISTSLLIILIQNPFSIKDIGLILSFSATLGIILFYKIILNTLKDPYKKEKINNKEYETNQNRADKQNKEKTQNLLQNISNKIKEITSVSMAAQIMILPLSMLLFNKISLTFLLSNIAVSTIIGLIIILGFISIICPLKICFSLLELMLEILKKIATIFANVPISNIVVTTPNIAFIVGYYALITLICYVIYLRKKEFKRRLEKQILTFVDKFKQLIFKNKKQILIFIITIIVLIQGINFIPKDLRIHFIDVGQGDSSLIITPHNKTILIDGGGSATSDFDVRKKYFTSIFTR